MALAHAKQVMALDLDPMDKNFPKILSTKTAIMSAVLTATTRVNEGALRKKNNDRIGQLLDELNARDPADELFS
ncbi:MAG: hypothetical protein KGO96_12415 [Elusimicrobia bacterium]|nr:hypothetical protein [Elusimicrobiota bacterium]